MYCIDMIYCNAINSAVTRSLVFTILQKKNTTIIHIAFSFISFDKQWLVAEKIAFGSYKKAVQWFRILQ
jgi:hypothetical protein